MARRLLLPGGVKEVRGHTAARVRAEIEPHELVDELAHAHVAMPLEPRTVEIRERDDVQEERVEREERDGLPLPAVDRDDGGDRDGSGGSKGEGAGEQFVFVDGRAVLATAEDRPLQELPFDATALSAGFLAGGLDLVAEGAMVRMVFNGRLRLSPMAAREDRRVAASLLSPLKTGPIEEVELRPYGPVHLRFDLDAQMLPILDDDATLAGLTYGEAHARMRRALDEGRERDFARMSAELGAVYETLRSIAELDPDLTFQELKLLLVDLGTPELAARHPDLTDASGHVDARRWVQAWERVAASGDGRALERLSRLSVPQLRFLLADAEGRIFGDDDARAIRGERYEDVRDVAVHLVRMRVLSAELWRSTRSREQRMASLLDHDVPRGVAFAGDPSFGAAVLGLARAARGSKSSRFEESVVRGVGHGEDRDGPRLETALGDVTPDDLARFARAADPREQVGLVDRLASADPVLASSVDALAVAMHLRLEGEGIEGGLLGSPPPERVAEALLGTPVRSQVLRPAEISERELSAALADLANDGGALIVERDGAREAAAAWGLPRLHGTPVRAEDLVLATDGASRDAVTRGLTNLANTLERRGAAAEVVDDLTALKSRANRADPADAIERARVVGEVVDRLRARLELAPLATHPEGAPLIITLVEGRPRFVAAGEGIDALVLLEPS